MVQSINAQPAETGTPDVVARLVANEGSAAHEYVSSETLLKSRFATRNLADAIHYLAALHGRYPGVVDMAATRTASPAAGKWLIAAVDGFAIERNYLTRLAVAAGPLPSTPGQAECEAAVIGQRHALEMLAQSDREGCAIGAALALVCDWRTVREVLDAAADRLSVAIPPCRLPDAGACHDITVAIVTSPAVERAMAFGAQQLVGQHRGLWDLLEARQLARGEY
jgi:hypothetical protein